MSLDGFTSSTTGEQLFTLTGSVTGTYSGVLTIEGTDLDVLEAPTVTGQQYTTVTFGDMVLTDALALIPIEIVSTANGGAKIQIGDAVITLAVTYVAPGPVITAVKLDNNVASLSGNNEYVVSLFTTIEEVNDLAGESYNAYVRIEGSNLDNIQFQLIESSFVESTGAPMSSTASSSDLRSRTVGDGYVEFTIGYNFPELNSGKDIDIGDRAQYLVYLSDIICVFNIFGDHKE